MVRPGGGGQLLLIRATANAGTAIQGQPCRDSQGTEIRCPNAQCCALYEWVHAPRQDTCPAHLKAHGCCESSCRWIVPAEGVVR